MISRHFHLLSLASYFDIPFGIPFKTPFGLAFASSTSKRPKRRLWSKLVLQALAANLLVIAVASPTLAATRKVTSLADDGSSGTLRLEIAAAAAGDTITFGVTGTITLSQGDLEISKNLIVRGPDAATVSISGADTFTVFQIDAGVAAVISGVTIEHGYASSASGGGGINNQGALALIQCTVTNNLNGDDGSDGEGIYNSGTLTLAHSTVSNNISSNNGAGIYNSGTVEVISSSLSGNGGGLPGAGGGGIYNASSGTLRVIESTLSSNGVHDGGQGAGIYNGGWLKVENSTFSDNSDYFGQGAGIYNSGTLRVLNSTFSGNSAIEDNGGAIVNTGTANVMHSTLSSNSATNGGDGGGIYNAGTLTLVDSTLWGNSATGGHGGAIFNGSGKAEMSFSTLAGNSADKAGAIFNIGTLSMKSTLLAGQSSGGNCFDSVVSSSASEGYNLADDSTCTFLTQTGDQNNSATAGLSPSGLQNNGGPTQTLALLPASSAVNAIPGSACTNTFGKRVPKDQRGVNRTQGGMCDIGAYELSLKDLLSGSSADLAAPK